MAHQTEIMVHGVMTEVTQFDHSTQEIDDAVNKVKWLSNPNLLDNWYFADPIDQRGGYVVPGGTAYYSDTGLSAQAGSVDAYTKAVNADGVYGTITVSGTAYYVPWSAAVRGYVGMGYGIDRWKRANPCVALPAENGLSVIQTTNSGFAVTQDFNPPLPAGTYTLSVLIPDLDGTVRLNIRRNGNSISYGTADFISAGMGKLTVDAYDGIDRITIFPRNTDETMTLLAAKLELGNAQTLAHQDEEGNWVLNDPPPDKALELAKCQRYYEKSYSLNYEPGRPKSFANEIIMTAMNTTTFYNGNVRYQTRKRATPNITLYSTQSGLAGKAALVGNSSVDVDVEVGNLGDTGFTVSGTNLTAGSRYMFQYFADANL